MYICNQKLILSRKFKRVCLSVNLGHKKSNMAIKSIFLHFVLTQVQYITVHDSTNE